MEKILDKDVYERWEKLTLERSLSSMKVSCLLYCLFSTYLLPNYEIFDLRSSEGNDPYFNRLAFQVNFFFAQSKYIEL